jgi:heat shock protein HslJ
MNLRTYVITVSAIGLMILFACQPKTDISKNESVPDGHTAQDALDWQGTYWGNTPCADCEKIENRLTLHEDMTYELISIYHKNDNTLADTISGSFSWSGNNIQLEGIPASERPAMYKVEENKVRQLDMNGMVITGNMADMYILQKTGNHEIEDKRWQIQSISGKNINGTPDRHYLIFHSDMSKAEAKANCNMMSWGYIITALGKVSFTQGVSTKMACPDRLEDEFIKALKMAENYKLDGDTLTFSGENGEVVALFKLVTE